MSEEVKNLENQDGDAPAEGGQGNNGVDYEKSYKEIRSAFDGKLGEVGSKVEDLMTLKDEFKSFQESMSSLQSLPDLIKEMQTPVKPEPTTESLETGTVLGEDWSLMEGKEAQAAIERLIEAKTAGASPNTEEIVTSALSKFKEQEESRIQEMKSAWEKEQADLVRQEITNMRVQDEMKSLLDEGISEKQINAALIHENVRTQGGEDAAATIRQALDNYNKEVFQPALQEAVEKRFAQMKTQANPLPVNLGGGTPAQGESTSDMMSRIHTSKGQGSDML